MHVGVTALSKVRLSLLDEALLESCGGESLKSRREMGNGKWEMGNGKWEVGIKIEIERLLEGESEIIIQERKDSWERYHCRRGKHKTRSKSKLVLERPTELEVKTRDPFTRGRMGIHSM
jgi:hypothetical protein